MDEDGRDGACMQLVLMGKPLLGMCELLLSGPGHASKWQVV